MDKGKVSEVKGKVRVDKEGTVWWWWLTFQVIQFTGVATIWEGVAFEFGISKVQDGRQQLQDAADVLRAEPDDLHGFLHENKAKTRVWLYISMWPAHRYMYQ